MVDGAKYRGSQRCLLRVYGSGQRTSARRRWGHWRPLATHGGRRRSAIRVGNSERGSKRGNILPAEAGKNGKRGV